MKIRLLYFIVFNLLMSLNIQAQQQNKNIHIIGQMKNVMWKGELYGTLNLDTITNKKNLYGLGPVEYLTGEIIVIDGKSYTSKVVSKKAMKVQETYEVKAPFFGYSNIKSWKEQLLPDSIQTIKDLEKYLDLISFSAQRPFMFKLTGKVKEAIIHVVNLPKGSKVNSPDQAHNGQTDYPLKNQLSEIIGFFSTDHQSIFTHHDTYLHMHLISSDKQKMGHLDKLSIGNNKIKLYIPTEY